VTVTFQEIGYVIKSKRQEKVILEHVSGAVKAGHIMAIMGKDFYNFLSFLSCFLSDDILFRILY